MTFTTDDATDIDTCTLIDIDEITLASIAKKSWPILV
jgi:hypothetical protein